jgi:hypothetical protein
MKRLLSEAAVQKIYDTLIERFGEPIGKSKDAGPGVADERTGEPKKGEDPSNYGWGSAKLSESAMTCSQCGGMMGLDEETCTQCGMMTESGAYDVPWKCKLGKHDWGPPVKFRLRHESKPNAKKPWAHMCDATRKFCKSCGKNGDIISTCKGVIGKVDDRPLSDGMKMDDIDVDTNRDYTFDRGTNRISDKFRGVHESEGGGRHPGHASSCTCPDCSRPSE